MEAYEAFTGGLMPEMKVLNTWWLVQNKDTVSDDAPRQFKDTLGGFEFGDDERPAFFAWLMQVQCAH